MAEFKGHFPTPRKLEKARREGKVLKSSLITQLSSMLSLFAMLSICAWLTWVRNRILLQYCWSEGFLDPAACAVGMGWILLELVVPGLIFGALVSIIVESLQVGMRFNAALAAPRSSSLDVGNGIKKIGSGLRGSWQFALRLGFFSLVLLWFFPDMIALGASLWGIGQERQMLHGLKFFGSLFAFVLAGVAAAACLEYMARRRDFYRELSMSSNDLKQEYREDEGDPQMRAQRQSLYRSMTYAEVVSRTRRSSLIVVERSE